MKISMQWLGDYLPDPPEPSAAADRLTHGGLPVEHILRAGDDTVIDVEVTSNRSDCLSHLGVGRELSALLGRSFRDVAPTVEEAGDKASSAASVTLENLAGCPHYSARVLRNVKIADSPAWMRRRLETIGVRPINNVVDVTNYVLFELGQPLHAFDLDKLNGRRIIVRNARAGEKIVSIDGRERELSTDMLVIADAARPVAIAGVMGGLESEVSGSTRNILLESARFDPLCIRRTARRLAMGSDSSYRFERGIDPLLPLRASLRAAQLINETAGGELLAGVIEAGASGYHPKSISLRLSRIQQVLGISLPPEQVIAALAHDHLQPIVVGDRIDCTIPSYRLDLNIEVDLIEEVARLIGYDKVPIRDEIAIRLTPPDPKTQAMNLIRGTLVAAGFFEAITFSFVSDALAPDFIPTAASPDHPLMRTDSAVRKSDANLRPSLLPGLLESARHNESVGNAEPRLFEIGSVFFNNSQGDPHEERRIGIIAGPDFHALRGAIDVLLHRLDASREIAVIPDARPGFSRGACGRVEWGGTAIGQLGKIDRAVAQNLSLRELPTAAELLLEPLLAGTQHVPQLKPLPTFPTVRRDLSLVVPESTPYEKIETLIRSQKPEHLEELQYVTTYRGKPLENGQKSVTITLVFRSPHETLTSDRVDAAMHRAIEAASRQGWTQRV